MYGKLVSRGEEGAGEVVQFRSRGRRERKEQWQEGEEGAVAVGRGRSRGSRERKEQGK